MRRDDGVQQIKLCLQLYVVFHIRVVIAADNSIADQRIESAPGTLRCEYFDALDPNAN